MIPYDPTRQTFTNDLSRRDIDVDKKQRELETEELATTKIVDCMFEQRRDRKQMAAEDVAKARDLLHAYGDARVRTYAAAPYPVANVSAAVAADAFAKLMILVEALAKGAYE